MWMYILKRLLWAIPTLFTLSLLVFFMVHLVPGDPARIILGDRATPEALAQVRKDLGLDQPIYIQYIRFLKKALVGDFGKSIKSGEPVMAEFKARFPATLELSLVAMFFAIFLGILAGIFAALYRNTWIDYLTMTFAISGVSMPVFWLGLLLIYFFSVQLGIFPVSGRISDMVDLTHQSTITGLFLVDSLLWKDLYAFKSALKHLILPALTLSTIPGAIIARMTRSSLIEVLQEDYIRTAKAKGCSSWRIILLHSLRNAMIPVITVIGLMLGTLLAGAVLTETTFSWPGIGKWIVKAVEQRDYPIIQGATLMIGIFFISINLLVDILYAWINPEIRL